MLSTKQKRPPSKKLNPSNTFPREKKANITTLTSNNPLLEGTHQSLSSPSRLFLAKYNTLKNEAKTSTSQSWAVLAKLTNSMESPESFKWAATKAYFVQAIPYKYGKAFFWAIFPHHRSCQNLVWLENFFQPPFLIFFHHSPYELPNLESTTTLLQASSHARSAIAISLKEHDWTSRSFWPQSFLRDRRINLGLAY